MKRIALLFIALLLLVITVSADPHQDAIGWATRINDTLYNKVPINFTLTDKQIRDTGYIPARDGGYTILIKNISYDESTGTLVTYLNAWNNGNSIAINNPVRWYIPLQDNGDRGAKLEQDFVTMVIFYLENIPYGEPINDDTLVIKNSVCGDVFDNTATTYYALRADTGSSSDNATVTVGLGIDTSTTSGQFHIFWRGISSFNTSALPDTATITSANFTIRGYSKASDLGSPSFGITGGTLTNNNSIVNGDYDGWQNTRYASDISYAAFSTTGNNTWSFGAAGLANISKDSFTVLYVRDSWDIDNSSPTWSRSKSSGANWYCTGAIGNEPTLTIIYSAGSPPESNFTANVTSGTEPLSVAFTDTSTNTPTSWSWAYKNASVGWTVFNTSQNPIQSFAAGLYDINLTATNAAGSDDEVKTGYINVSSGGVSPPVASFTINRNPVRIPQSITCTDTSTNTPTAWNWSWGDGTSNDTSQNPTHSYKKRGRWNIILTATNAGGSGVNSSVYEKVFGYEIYF